MNEVMIGLGLTGILLAYLHISYNKRKIEALEDRVRWLEEREGRRYHAKNPTIGIPEGYKKAD